MPLPELPVVIVSHEALLVAVQAQPAPAVTGTLPVEAVAPTLAVIGEIDVEQAVPA